MMNREGEHVVVCRAAQHVDAMNRSLDEIKGFAVGLLQHFVEYLRPLLLSRKLTVGHVGGAFAADELQGPILAGQQGGAQSFLSINDALNGRLGFLPGERAFDLDVAANVVAVVPNGNWGVLPQFTLRKTERREAGLAALEPLLEAGTTILLHYESWLLRFDGIGINQFE